MASLNPEILDAAFNLKLIPKALTRDECLCLHESILTVNEVYYAIEKSPLGTTLDGLGDELELNKNTLAQVCRWLEGKGLIEVERDEGLSGKAGRRKNVYFLP